jgi:mycothiol system anti-sigma-R factor
MISCSEAVRRLWEYVDGNLDDVDRTLVEEHLARCRRCCGELEFSHELRRLLRDAVHEPLPDDVLQRLNRSLEGLEP